jgi:hypothetical protein
MLTAAFATAVLVSGAQAAPRSPLPNPLALIEVEPPVRYPHRPPRVLLARVHPVTLRPRSPTLDLGYIWPDWGSLLARSPDGKRAAVQAGARTFLVDLQTMRRVATLPVAGRMFAWPSRRRLVVANDAAHRVEVVDPEATVVLETHEFGGHELFDVRIARGSALIVAGSPGAPLRFIRITPGRQPRAVVLRSMWLGIESRRAGARDPLPPGARAALEGARAAVARAESVPVSAVKSVAVTPAVFRTSALGCRRFSGTSVISPGYQILVETGDRTHDYRAGLRGGDPWFCQHGSVPSARNLLRVPRSAHHVTAAALATDPTGRAFIVAPEGIVAEVPVERQTVRLRKLAEELPAVHIEAHGDDVSADWVGDGRLVYSHAYHSPSGFRIDLKTGGVRVLAERDCWVDARVGLILVYGLRCRGLDARAPSGRRWFRLFELGPPVSELARTRRYAYVRLEDRSQVYPPRKTLRVVDLTRGAVVGQVEVRASTTVISE